jgi:hypothetical protein
MCELPSLILSLQIYKNKKGSISVRKEAIAKNFKMSSLLQDEAKHSRISLVRLNKLGTAKRLHWQRIQGLGLPY